MSLALISRTALVQVQRVKHLVSKVQVGMLRLLQDSSIRVMVVSWAATRIAGRESLWAACGSPEAPSSAWCLPQVQGLVKHWLLGFRKRLFSATEKTAKVAEKRGKTAKHAEKRRKTLKHAETRKGKTIKAFFPGGFSGREKTRKLSANWVVGPPCIHP